jgi:uncharacterized repeat protein (TIGR03803 family)
MKQRNRQSLLILGLVLSMSGSAAKAQTYTPIHNNDWTLDGCCQANPGLLAEGRDGNVYGTNASELPQNMPPIPGDGVLIGYSPSTGAWARYYFQGGPDGKSPLSGVTLGVDGNLYGATEWGTTSTQATGSGYGTVFKFTPGVSASPVHVYDFTDTANSSGIVDGEYPWAPPVQEQDGSLWGVSNSGTWYKMNTSGAIVNSGTLPYSTAAPMIVSLEEGTLYGTTANGGTYGKGTVYRLTQAGVLTTIYSFNTNNLYEGLSPSAPVVEGFDGFLYGTTCWGGKTAGGMNGGSTGQGTVFRVSRDGSSFATIYDFQDNVNEQDGYCPMAGLVQANDGMLYGVTSAGGGGTNTSISGTLFRLDTGGGNFQVLHKFDKPNGSSPLSTPLLHTNGKIYGMASLGGTSGKGVFYSYDPGLGQAGQFARLVGPTSGPAGTVLNVLGQGFNTATGVLIGGVAVPWAKLNHPNIISDTFMQVTVPAGVKNGYVTIQEPTGNLVTREAFKLTCTPGYLGCITRL